MQRSEGDRSREERINRAIADWFENLERGRCDGRREFLEQHPDLSPELAEFLRDYGLLQRAAADLSSPQC